MHELDTQLLHQNIPMKAGLFSVQAGLDETKSGAVRVDELPNLQNENVFHDYTIV